MNIHIFFKELPITQPPTIEDPWKADSLEDIPCVFQVNLGVYYGMHRYNKETGTMDLIQFPYPSFDEFVTDLHLMGAMIADGPL